MKLTSEQKKTLIYIVIFLLALFTIKWIFGFVSQPKAVNVSETASLASPLDSWLVKLAQGENCKPIGTWDTGSYSYGKYCFKKSTWITYAKRAEIAPFAEDEELMNFVGDNWAQDEVARWMFFNEKNAYLHWETTVLLKKEAIGMPPV